MLWRQPQVASTALRLSVKGSDATTAAFRAIRGTVDGDPLEIRVYGQASGGGSAAVTAGDDGLTAGGEAANHSCLHRSR